MKKTTNKTSIKKTFKKYTKDMSKKNLALTIFIVFSMIIGYAVSYL